MDKGRVIVIDDEVNILKTVKLSLTSQGFETDVFSDPDEALNAASEKYYDLAFIDLKMNTMNGIEVLQKLKTISSETTVVIMTAYGTIESAVESMKLGAVDYISKPFTHKEFIHLVEKIFENHKLKREVNKLRQRISSENNGADFITGNNKVIELLETAKEAAGSDLSIMIEGESGTGKELLAKFIHQNSPRRESPFIVINCAAIPENLFESEMFGHVKGSFTGAVKDRIGRLEMADKGTLFLDEVADIPKQMQVKLLRFLQNMEFERVGESLTRKIDIRIISATNKNIEEEISEGNLREDFYYRISGLRLKLPALKDRKEDILLLAKYFIERISGQVNLEISDGAKKILVEYEWPGNIREFENVIKRVIVFAKGGIIKPEHLPVELLSFKPKFSLANIPKIEDLERQHIIDVLKLTNNPKDAARILGISETTLWRKKKEYDI